MVVVAQTSSSFIAASLTAPRYIQRLHYYSPWEPHVNSLSPCF